MEEIPTQAQGAILGLRGRERPPNPQECAPSLCFIDTPLLYRCQEYFVKIRTTLHIAQFAPTILPCAGMPCMDAPPLPSRT